VSLRDIPATVVDLLGLERDSPFPGRSLAVRWDSARAAASVPSGPLLSETADEKGSQPTHGTPARAILDEGKVYIRNKNGREELYDIEADPAESHDLTASPRSGALLAHFRAVLAEIDAQAPASAAPAVAQAIPPRGPVENRAR
jgi:arylsulfatase A-like enzyme